MAGWTDYWSDWSSAAALAFANESVLLEACHAAFTERASVLHGVGWSVPTLTPVESLDALWDAMLTALSGMVANGSFSSYVDHTDSSGDWDDQADIPVWTEALIITELGLSAWPSMSALEARPKQVVKDFYDIINILLWHKRNALGANPSGPSATFTPEESIRDVLLVTDTWAVTVAAWNAASWGAWVGKSDALPWHRGTYERIHPERYQGIQRTRSRWDGTIHPNGNLSTSYNLDFYAQMGQYNFDQYRNNDYPVTQGNYARVYNGSVLETGYNSDIVYIGDFDTVTVPEPPFDTYYGWAVDQVPRGVPSGAELIYAVFKHDVTGGFDFVAP